MLVKLNSGYFGDTVGEGESEHQLEKDALLVYTGKFNSMDGEVDITEEHLSKMVDSHNSMLSKLSRLATGEVPLKQMPPVQLDHSTSAMMTVGRMVGDLRVGDAVIEGEKKKALFGKVRILGKENVDKVKDGRWTNLSIGADLESGKLNELTITPFPAAPKASLLKDGKTRMGGIIETYQQDSVSVDICEEAGGKFYAECKYLDVSKKSPTVDSAADAREAAILVIKDLRKDGKLSKGAETMDMAKHLAALKKHLMEAKKLSDKDADEHLKKMEMAEYKECCAALGHKLEADTEMSSLEGLKAHMKKLAEGEPDKDKEDKEKEEKKMSAIKMVKDFRDSQKTAHLAAKKATIMSRLSKLKADAKITPAEVKKIEIAKLAEANEATIDAVLKSYEDREPVIIPGVFGSMKATSLADITKQAGKVKLEHETRMNMPSKRAEHQKKLAEVDPSKMGDVDPRKMDVDPTKMDGQEGPHTPEVPYEHLAKLLDEGKHEEVKEHLKKLYEHMGKMRYHGMEHSEEEGKSVSDLADGLKKMQTSFDELVKLVSGSVGLTEKDLN